MKISREKTAAVDAVTNQSGMTLIEVMVACVILMVGVLGLGILQIHAMKTNTAARRMTEATNVASDRIEQIMSNTWTHPSLVKGAHAETQGGYRVSWNVANASNGRSKTVQVAVAWTVDGHPHRLTQVVVRPAR